MSLREEFLDYCTNYVYNKPRVTPANPRTIARYRRGLVLCERIIGKSLDSITDADQLYFMSKIREYKQGTRRVSTQILQRFLAWAIKREKLTCSNLILGHEDDIIGPDTPVTYANISKNDIERFLTGIESDENRIMFTLIYYCGLTAEEACLIKPSQVIGNKLILKREVMQAAQITELPQTFRKELIEYAEKHQELETLFNLPSNPDLGRQIVYKRYNQEVVLTKQLIGTTFRDFRIASIRHFFQDTQDPELTKQFAGVPGNKKGWLDKLITYEDTYLSKAAKARKYYGKKQLEAK